MINIKPHHFVDILTGFGKGNTDPEPHPYGHAVHTVTRAVLADPDVDLRVEIGADDICTPCRHNVNGACDDTIDTSYRPEAPPSKQEWNLLLDRRWCERLGLGQGETLTARELAARIRENSEDIQDIYREIPADRNDERRANLHQGIDWFLARAT